MNLYLTLSAPWRFLRIVRARRAALRSSADDSELLRDSWADSLRDPTGFYLRCFRYFHRRLPKELRQHRAYFDQARRGFGEDAFHVMWFVVFREIKPAHFLEIGVYRGQTISLAGLLARLHNSPCEIHGISPFSNAGDSVSKYLGGIDYYEDTVKNVEYFDLPRPHLLKAYSTDGVAVERIQSRQWDIIYIDGNHDYEVARQDWALSSAAVRPGGIVVLDDSGLTTSYQPPAFATGGHPGPSRIAREIDPGSFREILQVGHNRVFQRIS